jgi:hypothetical protein
MISQEHCAHKFSFLFYFEDEEKPHTSLQTIYISLRGPLYKWHYRNRNTHSKKQISI